jgi:mono/diheme cytochrome c family protein
MTLFLCLNRVCLFRRPQFGVIRLWITAPFALSVLCLAVCGRPGWAQAKEASSAAPDKAGALFQRLCQGCHAADGWGDPGTKGVPNFTRRGPYQQKSDAQLIVSVLDGTGSGMPAFQDRLSQAQAKELVGYIRSFAPTEPAEQPATRAGAVDFEAQLQQLQREYRKLQKQLKEAMIDDQPSERRSQPPAEKQHHDPGTEESMRAAGVLFRSHCQRCHGADGKGVAGKLDSPDPPDFSGRGWQEERSNAGMLKSILDGKKKGMPAFRKKVSEDQARDRVDYVRAFTPPRRANSTKPEKDPGDGPCRHKNQERRLPSERLGDMRLCIMP